MVPFDFFQIWALSRLDTVYVIFLSEIGDIGGDQYRLERLRLVNTHLTRIPKQLDRVNYVSQ